MSVTAWFIEKEPSYGDTGYKKFVNLSNKYSQEYVLRAFTLWYELGKPIVRDLWSAIPEYQFTQDKPTIATLQTWIGSEDWIERAYELDSEVEKHFKEKQIQSKVEMLERHAELGREMQEMSYTWLKTHQDQLTPGTAVRMLVEGVNIEQATAGIPEALKKMMTMKDEDVQKEIIKLLADTPSSYESLDADN